MQSCRLELKKNFFQPVYGICSLNPERLQPFGLFLLQAVLFSIAGRLFFSPVQISRPVEFLMERISILRMAGF